jgi:hypothetical protein
MQLLSDVGMSSGKNMARGGGEGCTIFSGCSGFCFVTSGHLILFTVWMVLLDLSLVSIYQSLTFSTAIPPLSVD